MRCLRGPTLDPAQPGGGESFWAVESVARWLRGHARDGQMRAVVVLEVLRFVGSVGDEPSEIQTRGDDLRVQVQHRTGPRRVSPAIVYLYEARIEQIIRVHLIDAGPRGDLLLGTA